MFRKQSVNDQPQCSDKKVVTQVFCGISPGTEPQSYEKFTLIFTYKMDQSEII